MMSDDSKSADQSNPFASFWINYFEQADAQSKALLGSMQTAADPQELQKRWLETISRSLDTYMRSPAFLEAMQRNLKSMTDMKGVQDQVVQDFARFVGLPLASDINGLFERLYSVEHTILARLKGIEGRLSAIETKLGSDQGHS
jgi:hypothetical protein